MKKLTLAIALFLGAVAIQVQATGVNSNTPCPNQAGKGNLLTSNTNPERPGSDSSGIIAPDVKKGRR